jgi:hypothetical protein
MAERDQRQCVDRRVTKDVQGSMFQVRIPRILSFEGSIAKVTKDPSGQALNIEL